MSVAQERALRAVIMSAGRWAEHWLGQARAASDRGSHGYAICLEACVRDHATAAFNAAADLAAAKASRLARIAGGAR